MREPMPVVLRFFNLLETHECSIAEVGRRAGIDWRTIQYWKSRSHPRLDLFCAAAEALGYEVRLIKKP